MKKKLLLCLGSLGAALVLAEVVLRVFCWGWITQIYVLDEECLFRPKPSSAHYFQYLAPNDGPRIIVEVNSDGYRGPDRALVEGESRVLVFGDSFIMGEFSAHEDTFCAQLEQRMVERLARPVHVVNAGTAGGGPDQYIPRLKAELPIIQPDLVIVAMFAGNDFGDLVRDKMFRLGDGGELVPVPFTFSEKLRNQFAGGDGLALYRLVRRYRKSQRWGSGWEKMKTETPAEQLAMAHKMIEADLGLCRAEYREFVTHGRNDIRALLEDHHDSDIGCEPNSESARYKVGLMESVLARITEVVRAADVPLLFVAIPTPVDVCKDYAGGIVDREKYPDYRASRLTDEVVRIVQALDTPVLDLFEPFLSRGDELYFQAPDVHWNNAGQLLAAELTAKKIEELGVFAAK